MSDEYPMSQEVWAPCEIEHLIKFGRTKTDIDLSLDLKRSPDAVQRKRCQIGVKKGSLRPWTKEEVDVLALGLPNKETARRLKRGIKSVIDKRKSSGLAIRAIHAARVAAGEKPSRYVYWTDERVEKLMILAYVDGIQMRRIAKIMGKPVGSIVGKLHRIRRKRRENL